MNLILDCCKVDALAYGNPWKGVILTLCQKKKSQHTFKLIDDFAIKMA
jgi:uncharacterized protein (UPF0218 family)